MWTFFELYKITSLLLCFEQVLTYGNIALNTRRLSRMVIMIQITTLRILATYRHDNIIKQHNFFLCFSTFLCVCFTVDPLHFSR
jgi:hypothetical protein